MQMKNMKPFFLKTNINLVLSAVLRVPSHPGKAGCGPLIGSHEAATLVFLITTYYDSLCDIGAGGPNEL